MFTRVRRIYKTRKLHTCSQCQKEIPLGSACYIISTTNPEVLHKGEKIKQGYFCKECHVKRKEV